MQSISPCLWFDDQAEAAVNFYVGVFKNSKIITTTHYGEEASKVARRPKGSVMTVAFELDGQNFLALNGGPAFQFTPAISLMVDCQSQAEIDELWDKLSDGGQYMQCGWLTDKFGITWQIVPAELARMWESGDPKRMDNVMKALMTMVKLDLAALKRAYEEAA